MTAPQFPPGQLVAGKYTVRGLMGYCGAAATYVAVVAPGRDVVVKIFSPQLTDRGDVLAGLQQSMAIATSLSSESSAPVLDSGFDPTTRAPFFVTDVVPLPSLAQAVARAPLPLGDVLALLRGVARALDAAHVQRVAHGALRPQNVFLGPAPQRQVRVIDFGVALARAAFPTGEGRASAAPWMAPEQLQAGPFGPAADVFSAALVAFFAATGRPYWRCCQAGSPDLADWQNEVTSPRVPPSVRAQELGAQLPPGLDAALTRALAVNPADRFGTVSELAEAFAQGAGLVPLALGGTLAVPVMPMVWPPMAMEPGAPPPAPPAPSVVVAVAPGRQESFSAAPAPPKSRGALFVVLGLLALAVLGGVVALVVVLRGRSGATPSPSAAASTAAVAPTAPAPSAPSAAASASEAPPSAVPPASAAAAASEPVVDAAADGPAPAQLVVVCMPECDSLTVDDASVSTAGADGGPMDPMELTPGAHTLVAGKASFVSQTRKITVRPGQKDRETFFLSRPGPAPARPCGKFLERCP